MAKQAAQSTGNGYTTVNVDKLPMEAINRLRPYAIAKLIGDNPTAITRWAVVTLGEMVKSGEYPPATGTKPR